MSEAAKVIVALESENVKRLKAVKIEPSGEVVVIAGDNGAGKSSVLDSIAYALGGEKLHPPEVVRHGAKSARVTVDLGDLKVERKWTARGSTLTVSAKDGAKYSSPQKVLDKLVGSLAFDPLAFMRQEPRVQLDTLRRLAGLDFAAHDAERKRIFDERTAVNRRASDATAQAAGMPSHPDAPKEEVKLADLLARQEALTTQARKRDAMVREVEGHEAKEREAHGNVESADAKLADIDSRIAELQTKRRAWEEAKVRAVAAGLSAHGLADEARAKVAATPEPDFDPIRQEIAGAEQVNRQVRENVRRAETVARATAADQEAAALTKRLAALDEAKAKAIARAKFPVEGLSVTDSGVTFRDVPLEQASSAEQLRVSLAIGLALNPTLRVMLVRDGSLLDQKSFALVAEMARQAGAQVWIERVGKGDAGAVVIEDGEVAS